MLLLGLRDKAISGASTRSLTENQLGGLPTWPYPSLQRPSCGLCGAPSWLVVQIHAPLTHSLRILYIFSCVAEACQNRSEAWTVLRGHGVERRVERECTVEKKEVDDWGVDGDSWGDDDEGDTGDSGEPTNNVSAALDTLNITESYPEEEESGQGWFRPYYLYVDDEPEQAAVTSSVTSLPLQEQEEDERGKGGGEKYERSDVKDRPFYRFYKRLSRCPEQCLRYELGGTPLLSDPSSQVPPCGVCGGPRQFELQLMPALISILRPSHSGGPKRSLDYRTVQVFTCVADCPVLAEREWAVCVPEPDVVLPNRTTATASRGS